MQYILVKTPNGEVRGALNTCQVCNGSLYAFFVPNGDSVVCQNCQNEFPLDVIGLTHTGCNPVPLEITEENEGYSLKKENAGTASDVVSVIIIAIGVYVIARALRKKRNNI